MTEPWWLDEAPARPIKVTGGIQINSARGSVARTWWSKRFLARAGADRGRRPDGPRPGLRPPGPDHLDGGRRGRRAGHGAGQQAAALHRAGRRARVRQGGVGRGRRGAGRRRLATPRRCWPGRCRTGSRRSSRAVGLSLFPASARDLALDCTCPDQAVPCKHLAAVCYVLAERFDADPFEILALRGRDRETLLADLRTPTGRGGVGPSRGAPARPRCSMPSTRWPLPCPRRSRGPRRPPDALLDQIPPFPVALRGEPVTELLRPVYRGLGGA